MSAATRPSWRPEAEDVSLYRTFLEPRRRARRGHRRPAHRAAQKRRRWRVLEGRARDLGNALDSSWGEATELSGLWTPECGRHHFRSAFRGQWELGVRLGDRLRGWGGCAYRY